MLEQAVPATSIKFFVLSSSARFSAYKEQQLVKHLYIHIIESADLTEPAA